MMMKPLNFHFGARQLAFLHFTGTNSKWSSFVLPPKETHVFWRTSTQAVLIAPTMGRSMADILGMFAWAVGFNQIARPNINIYGASYYDAASMMFRFQCDQVNLVAQARNKDAQTLSKKAYYTDTTHIRVSRVLDSLVEVGVAMEEMAGTLDGEPVPGLWVVSELEEYLRGRLTLP